MGSTQLQDTVQNLDSLVMASAAIKTCAVNLSKIANGIDTFVKNCVQGITANRKKCRELVDNTIGILTALCPHVGYKKAAKIAKRAMSTGESLRKIILKEKILNEKDINIILNAESMTGPGISIKYAVYK